MRTAGFPRGRILLLVLFIGAQFPMTGCTDDSRTTGTVVEVPEEYEAHTKAKLGSYKGGPPKKTQAKATSKKN